MHWSELRISRLLQLIFLVPKPNKPGWLQEGNVLQGQPLYFLSHALQILTDTSKEG